MANPRPKSLGTLGWPRATLAAFDGHSGEATIEIATGTRRVVVKGNYYCAARTMVDLAKELCAKQREHAMREWNTYKRLKEMTGYKAPEGEE